MTESAQTETVVSQAPRKRGRPSKAKPAPVVDLAVVEAGILPRRAEAESQLQLLNAYPLDSQEAVDLFGQLLVEIRKAKDDLEAERTTITGPLNAAKKAVDALFRPMRDLLDSQDTTIVGRLAQYLTATRATQNKALEAVAGGARDAATLEVAHATPATPEGLSEVEEWSVEVVTPSEVPRQFLAVDTALVLAYVKHKAKNGEPIPTIPGLTVTKSIGLRRLPTRVAQ